MHQVGGWSPDPDSSHWRLEGGGNKKKRTRGDIIWTAFIALLVVGLAAAVIYYAFISP